jgi:hypothetical protein
VKLLILSFAITVSAVAVIPVASAATPSPDISPVTLRDSPAIQLEAKSQVILDALRIRQDPSIVLSHCRDITISCCELHSIKLIECTGVTIRNCWIHDSSRCGVETYHCRDLKVEGCRIENVATGLYAIDSSDIHFIGNFVRNVVGPFPRGQMVQFDNVTGRNCAIRGNYAVNEMGKSHPEDVINLYESRGEPGAPIVIEDNYVTGDPTRGSEGKSKTGSGIMLGDQGGAWLLCRHNIVLSAGQVGMGVAGGTDIRVEENLILGTRSNVSNVGLYAWNQSHAPSGKVTIIGNRVHWMDAQGESHGWWEGGNVDELELRENYFADDRLATSIPSPPSHAPFPPCPSVTTDKNGQHVVRIPWKG